MFVPVPAVPRLPNLPPVARYGVAAGCVGLAWLAKLFTDHVAPVDSPLFLWFIAATVFSAWYGGLGPGLFASILSITVADVILFKPHFAVWDRSAGQYVQIVVFGGIATFVSAFCGEVRRSRRQLAATLVGPESVSDREANRTLEERARLTRLEGEIGRVVAHAETLPGLLQGCVEAFVHFTGAAFSRIWIFDAAANVLRLQAHSGVNGGSPGQEVIPLGHAKFGRIAADREPLVTNQMLGDPRVENQEWVQREGMQAFAGFPLLAGGALQGVMAITSAQKISEGTVETLDRLSVTIALAVRQRETDRERTRLLQETQAARETRRTSLPRQGRVHRGGLP